LFNILKSENPDGVLIFMRTKHGTKRLAQRLAKQGYASAALNGDMAQSTREKTVLNFKKGQLDIMVATDVAARGLDVDRISHVINFDIPKDTESYVHRIGRTGRAGRQGKAILFVKPEEKHLLMGIEKVTKQKMTPLNLKESQEPSQEKTSLKNKIQNIIEKENLKNEEALLHTYQTELHCELKQIAAALLKLAQASNSTLKQNKLIKNPNTLKDHTLQLRPRPKHKKRHSQKSTRRH
ncbi:MAG: ATP-dependent helicase, partial [Deltaproteobacteria bacterium]|nr:ATP-dependent helicase [Deltaproteobacteria bacterium]